MSATTPRARVLRQAMTRCAPSRPCSQRCTCARAIVPLGEPALVVDASISVQRSGQWCPMFIDSRGLALLRVSA